MQNWVIAEWIDEDGERVRAPSFETANGVWYRAGAADTGGPTILRMGGQPVEVAEIQRANPQRANETADLRAIACRTEVRIAALGDMIERLGDSVISSLNRIERELGRHSHNQTHPAPWAAVPPPDFYGAGAIDPRSSGGMIRPKMNEFVIPDISDEVKRK